MAYGFYLEAEYEDGFVLTEDEADVSPFDPTANIFRAILHSHATDAGHGRMVRFSLIPWQSGLRYDIDWRLLWNETDPRPIYYREMHKATVLSNADHSVLEDSGPVCDLHAFGFQYIDKHGKNVTEVQEIAP